jgi:hypothetical protein
VLSVFFVIDFAARKARCQAKLWHASMGCKGEERHMSIERAQEALQATQLCLESSLFPPILSGHTTRYFG